MNSEIIHIRKLVTRLLRSWPVVILALILGAALAAFIAAVSPEFYKAEVSIMVEEPYRIDDPQRWILGEQRFNEPGRAYIVNEGIRMKELSLLRKTCDSLGLGIRYIEQGWLIDREIYDETPFRISMVSKGKNQPLPYGISFSVAETASGTYQITADDTYGPEETPLIVDVTVSAGHPFEVAGVQMTLTPVRENEFSQDRSYGFQLVDLNELSLDLAETVEIDAVELEASIFTASYLGSPKGKGTDILEVLSSVYVRKKLGERRDVLLTTLTTIRDEMKEIQLELARQEQEIEAYKSKESINSTEDQGKSLLEEIAAMELSRIDLQTRQEYLEYLQTSLDSSGNNQSLVVPSAYGVSDPSINELVASYNDLVLKRELYESSGQTAHPVYTTITSELVSKSRIIGETVDGFAESNQLRLNRLNSEIAQLKKRSAQLPYQQMELLRKDRSFHALDQNYRALNQRRVEVGIALASLSADVRVIEQAHSTSVDPLFPDPAILVIFIVLIALASPFIYLLVKTLLSDRITDLAELKAEIQKRFPQTELLALRKTGGIASMDALGKWSNDILRLSRDGKGLIAFQIQVSNTLLNENIEPLNHRIQAMGGHPLWLNFSNGEGMSFRDFIASISAGNLPSPLHTDRISKIDITWADSDLLLPDDKIILDTLKAEGRPVMMLLPHNHWMNAALFELSDASYGLYQYGIASQSSLQTDLNQTIKPASHLVFLGVPPAPFQWKGWFQSLAQNPSYTLKMLFNRI